MMSWSWREFILAMMCAGSPCLARFASRSILLMSARFISVGAGMSFLSLVSLDLPVMALKNTDASAP